MDRRVFGIETEYGITYQGDKPRTISADEIARYLFRKVVSWGRSSNVFLRNGSRLYLDVGSHPEYATAECLTISSLIAQDKAGERILEDLVTDAETRLRADEFDGTIYVFKNNSDSVGNSFGCHENYMISRSNDFSRLVESLIPFLITRQLLTGAGKVVHTPTGAHYALSQRSEHMWEGLSSATTRSRPIINTRDEPHANAEKYRRLHVIVGDSNMSEATVMLKVGMMTTVLRMLEADIAIRDLSLENPIRAIRDISNDLTGKVPVTLANGKTITPLEIQEEYFDRATSFLAAEGSTQDLTDEVMDLWGRGLEAIRSQDYSSVDTELDWVIKHRLINRYLARSGRRLSDPRVARLELGYHDISRSRGLYYKLAEKGAVRRITTDEQIQRAIDIPPQDTRAKLRGEFIRRAQEAGRDFTVDWVHLKLNDDSQRTVLCKDPFATEDVRVARLLQTMST